MGKSFNNGLEQESRFVSQVAKTGILRNIDSYVLVEDFKGNSLTF